MKLRTKYFFGYIAAMLMALLLAPMFYISAQTLTAADRTQLEAQLAQVQAEEAQAQSELGAAEAKSSSLQNAIAVVAAKIKTEQLDIEEKNLLIQTLGATIGAKQGEIDALDARIAQDKQDIADIFTQMQETDNISIVEVLASSQTLSQFGYDVVQLESLQNEISIVSTQLAADEASSTQEKAALVTQQNTAIDARYAIEQDQTKLQANESQQKQLLSISKTNERAYAALVAEKKKEADAINAKLFALAGGSNPIQFGQAYQYALTAQKETGVDPAFLLAIMTQESNLGTNQGNCYLTNKTTGAGVSVKTGAVFAKVMNPVRDVPPFLTITSDLGVDPLHTVVSCPQSVGWGGAMGPAQFIASTWMLLANRVAVALGLSGMANPWNPQHAFTASAFFLSDLGASGGGYTAEYNAACRYYSGSPCSISPLVASYGASVMRIASTIQTTEIDKLQGI